MPAPKKILIIGGGFTGLTAAWRLSEDRNFSVTLIESSDQLGGLAAAFRCSARRSKKLPPPFSDRHLHP